MANELVPDGGMINGKPVISPELFAEYCLSIVQQGSTALSLSSVSCAFERTGLSVNTNELRSAYSQIVVDAYQSIQSQKGRFPHELEIDASLIARGIKLAWNPVAPILEKYERRTNVPLPYFSDGLLISARKSVLESCPGIPKVGQVRKELLSRGYPLTAEQLIDLYDDILVRAYNSVAEHRVRTPWENELQKKLQKVGFEVDLTETRRLYTSLYDRKGIGKIITEPDLIQAYEQAKKIETVSYGSLSRALNTAGFQTDPGAAQLLFSSRAREGGAILRTREVISRKIFEHAYNMARQVLREKGARDIPTLEQIVEQLRLKGCACSTDWARNRLAFFNAVRQKEKKTELKIVPSHKVLGRIVKLERRFLHHSLNRKPTASELVTQYNLRMQTSFEKSRIIEALCSELKIPRANSSKYLNQENSSGVYNDMLAKVYKKSVTRCAKRARHLQIPSLDDVWEDLAQAAPEHKLGRAALAKRLVTLELRIQVPDRLTIQLLQEAAEAIRSKYPLPTASEVFESFLKLYPGFQTSIDNINDFIARNVDDSGEPIVKLQPYNEKVSDNDFVKIYDELSAKLPPFRYPSTEIVCELLHASKQAVTASLLRVNFERASSNQAPLLLEPGLATGDYRAISLLYSLSDNLRDKKQPVVKAFLPDLYANGTNVLIRINGVKERATSLGLPALPIIRIDTPVEVLQTQEAVSTLKLYRLFTQAQLVLENATIVKCAAWAKSIEDKIHAAWRARSLAYNPNATKGYLQVLGLTALEGRMNVDQFKAVLAALLHPKSSPTKALKLLKSSVDLFITGDVDREQITDFIPFHIDDNEKLHLLYGERLPRNVLSKVVDRLENLQLSLWLLEPFSMSGPTYFASAYSPWKRPPLAEYFSAQQGADSQFRCKSTKKTASLQEGGEQVISSIHGYQSISDRSNEQPTLSYKLASQMKDLIFKFEMEQFESELGACNGDLLCVSMVYPKQRNLGVIASNILDTVLLNSVGLTPRRHRKLAYQNVVNRLNELLTIPTVDDSNTFKPWHLVHRKVVEHAQGWRQDFFTFRAF